MKKLSDHTAEQWSCVNTVIKNGDSLNFTMIQCFKKPDMG